MIRELQSIESIGIPSSKKETALQQILVSYEKARKVAQDVSLRSRSCARRDSNPRPLLSRQDASHYAIGAV